jgi:CRP/FNR family transcriptional regulator, cyclic AMP receptor protein
MNKTSFLKRVPLLKGLSGADLDKVAAIATLREIRKGETIFTKSSTGDNMYIVVDGRVKIFSTSRMGKTKTFDYLESRDFFGEMALFESSDRSAAAKAVENSALLTIRSKDFQELLVQRPRIALSVLKTLCSRLRRADSEIESLSFNNVLGRIAHILLDLSHRYGKKTDLGTAIQLELSHQELADMAGTAREMVTRVLNRFKRANCIEMQGKTITLTNPDKLREWIF